MQLRPAMLLLLVTGACGPSTSADRDAGPGDGASTDTTDCPSSCSADLRQVLDLGGWMPIGASSEFEYTRVDSR